MLGIRRCPRLPPALPIFQQPIQRTADASSCRLDKNRWRIYLLSYQLIASCCGAGIFGTTIDAYYGLLPALAAQRHPFLLRHRETRLVLQLPGRKAAQAEYRSVADDAFWRLVQNARAKGNIRIENNAEKKRAPPLGPGVLDTPLARDLLEASKTAPRPLGSRPKKAASRPKAALKPKATSRPKSVPSAEAVTSPEAAPRPEAALRPKADLDEMLEALRSIATPFDFFKTSRSPTTAKHDHSAEGKKDMPKKKKKMTKKQRIDARIGKKRAEQARMKRRLAAKKQAKRAKKGAKIGKKGAEVLRGPTEDEVEMLRCFDYLWLKDNEPWNLDKYWPPGGF
ncbi:hypothetical protein JCM11641_007141 [Rhodosporidiobolus odoratus]